MWRCLLLAFGFIGCTNPDDILPMHGTLESIDPVEGQVVRLLREVGGENASFGGLCTVFEPYKETLAAR